MVFDQATIYGTKITPGILFAQMNDELLHVSTLSLI